MKRLPKKPRFIAVPFAEKDEAKSLGARWHPFARLWYVPDGLPKKLFRWPLADVSRETWAIAVEKERVAEAEEKARIAEAAKKRLKEQRHYFVKKNAEANRPTRQILAEGHQRLEHLLAVGE